MIKLAINVSACQNMQSYWLIVSIYNDLLQKF